jgi:hypothetical protein
MKYQVPQLFSQSVKFIIFNLVFTFLLMSNALAQRFEDVIYLSNGGKIHGAIIKDSTSRNIRILNHAGDIWAFDPAEIDSIKQEKPFEYKALQFNQRGFDFGINAELLLRSGNNALGKAAVPGLIMAAGYRINPYLYSGAEIGIELYDLMEIPLSACVRLRASGRALSPLLFVRAGYTLPAEKRRDDWDYQYESYGGVHSSVGAGIEKIMNNSTSFIFTFSYHYQELNYHLTPIHQWVQERNRKESYSRLRLGVGYVFK